jgi:hypothetical protein
MLCSVQRLNCFGHGNSNKVFCNTTTKQLLRYNAALTPSLEHLLLSRHFHLSIFSYNFIHSTVFNRGKFPFLWALFLYLFLWTISILPFSDTLTLSQITCNCILHTAYTEEVITKNPVVKTPFRTVVQCMKYIPLSPLVQYHFSMSLILTRNP